MAHTVLARATRSTSAVAFVDPSGIVVKFVALTFATGLVVAGAAQAEDSQALLQKYNCTICHANDEAKTGPAFVDVADKYRQSPRAASTIAAVVRKGVHGSGPWPMPPSPQVPPADARAMARYILALRE
jgi:cytochrome c